MRKALIYEEICEDCYGPKEEKGVFGQITQYQIREEVPQKKNVKRKEWGQIRRWVG